METNLPPTQQNVPVQQPSPVAQTAVAKLKTRLNIESVKAFIKDPKNKKLLILAAAFFAILILLFLSIVAVSLKNRMGKEVLPSPSPSSPAKTPSPVTNLDKLKSLENDLNSFDIEDRQLAPTELDFEVEFE